MKKQVAKGYMQIDNFLYGAKNLKKGLQFR